MAVETDPILFPTCLSVRMVGVPFSGEEEEHHSTLDIDGLAPSKSLAVELSPSLRNVQELVLLKNPSAVSSENVPGGVIPGGIVHSGAYFLEAG